MASFATQKLHWQQRRKPVQPNPAYLVQWAGMEEKQAVCIGKRAFASASRLQSVLSVSRSSEHIELQFQHWWQNVGQEALLKASHDTMNLDTKADRTGLQGESSDEEIEEGEVPDLKQDEQLEALKQCSESTEANAIRTLKELQAEAQVKEDIAKIEAGQTLAVLEDEDGQSKSSKPHVSVKADYPKTVAGMLVEAGVLCAFFWCGFVVPTGTSDIVIQINKVCLYVCCFHIHNICSAHKRRHTQTWESKHVTCAGYGGISKFGCMLYFNN